MTQLGHPLGHWGELKIEIRVFQHKLLYNHRLYSRTNILSHCIMKEWNPDNNLVYNITKWGHSLGHRSEFKFKIGVFYTNCLTITDFIIELISFHAVLWKNGLQATIWCTTWPSGPTHWATGADQNFKKLRFQHKMPQKYRFYSRTNIFTHSIM